MLRNRFFLAVLLAASLVAFEAVPQDEASAQPPAAEAEQPEKDAATTLDRAPQEMSSRHQAWLKEVEALINEEEETVFLGLTQDYQRDAFIRRFWQVRDPFPQTARNEFQERWEANRELARQLFTNAANDDRARMLGFCGEPVQRLTIRCSDYLKRLELWRYDGTPEIRFPFHLIFIRERAREDSPYKLWYPTDGLQPLLDWTVGSQPSDLQLLAGISENCMHGAELVAALDNTVDWNLVEEQGGLMPDPGDEWVRTFVAFSTDLPEGAETFPAEVELQFPGRSQSRTVVQGLISVPVESVELSDLEQRPSYNFVLDGEILIEDRLFEHFRYRFNLREDQAVLMAAGGPEPTASPAASPASASNEPASSGGAAQPASTPDTAPASATTAEASSATEPGTVGETREILPLVFQRYLRPGIFQLVLKVEDLNGERFFRQVMDLEVPRVENFAPSVKVASGSSRDTSTSARLLAEANADLALGDHSIQVLAPQSALMVGRLRVEALTRGEGIERVNFSLNDQPVFSKSRPPYSVELNLGEAPRVHTVRATALGAEGQRLATDEVVINAGPHRFDVRLVEPQRGQTYSQSVRAHAVVQVPEGERLDRVEIFLNDDKIATLYQPPFIQPLVIPENEPLSFVRAVGYLEGGNFTEDAVFVNAPDIVDEVDIHFVELYTSVLNRRGRPVRDLPQEAFTVLEEGEEQELRRFEQVENVPIHAGVLLDVSTSMVTRLDHAVKGALRFFEKVLTPKDRGAVITFNERPDVAVPFTNSLEVLAGGLAGLTAEGDTALYDSLIYGLYYFSGISGKRAIVLLSDGEDVRSRYTYDDVIDYARRTGVAIYAVGIDLSGRSTDIRLKLQRLAGETGGRSFFIDDAQELEKVYESIQEELRSQYLLAYQSPAEGEDFRRIEVQVEGNGLTANTLKGYFP